MVVLLEYTSFDSRKCYWLFRSGLVLYFVTLFQ